MTLSLENSNTHVQDDSTLNNNTTLISNESSLPKESQIKEKPKVYRDPFGNVISAPITKPDESKAKDTALNNGNEITQDNIKPTSSLALKTSSLNPQSNQDQDLRTLDTQGASINVAVVYFSVPEDIKSTDVDVLSGASKILLDDAKEQGTVEYLAHIISDKMQGKVFKLETINPYPTNHQELVKLTAQHKDNEYRPDISLSPEFNPSDFDVIFVGYPIWWHELPMPLYSFFEDYDLSGKTIIPFCIHGGSRPFKTFAYISIVEPNAQVIINNGLVLNRNKVASKGVQSIEKWLEKIKTQVLMPKYGHLKHFASAPKQENDLNQEQAQYSSSPLSTSPNEQPEQNPSSIQTTN